MIELHTLRGNRRFKTTISIDAQEPGNFLHGTSSPYSQGDTKAQWTLRCGLAHGPVTKAGEVQKLNLSDKSRSHRRLRRLRRAELPPDTVELARYLIGRVIVHDVGSGRLSGRIVETEAYPVGDAAGHAFRGETRRNRSLFLKRGHAYVYFAYGSSYLLNVTSEAPGVGGGVLLRAIEPLEGIERMAASRGTTPLAYIGRGPGRLAKALKIDLRQDGLDLCAPGPLWLAAGAPRTGPIGKSLRIGITRDADRVLRFYEPGDPHVSGPRKLSPIAVEDTD